MLISSLYSNLVSTDSQLQMTSPNTAEHEVVFYFPDYVIVFFFRESFYSSDNTLDFLDFLWKKANISCCISQNTSGPESIDNINVSVHTNSVVQKTPNNSKDLVLKSK